MVNINFAVSGANWLQHTDFQHQVLLTSNNFALQLTMTDKAVKKSLVQQQSWGLVHSILGNNLLNQAVDTDVQTDGKPILFELFFKPLHTKQ